MVKTDYDTENQTSEIQKPKNPKKPKFRFGTVRFSVYGTKVPTPTGEAQAFSLCHTEVGRRFLAHAEHPIAG
jgi:hypothetical protein